MNAPIVEECRSEPRLRWTVSAVEALFELPFSELIFRAQCVHRTHFDPHEVQLSTLLSIKTGGCPEDCAYCPQSVRFKTGVADEELLPLETVLDAARAAKADPPARASSARRPTCSR